MGELKTQKKLDPLELLERFNEASKIETYNGAASQFKDRTENKYTCRDFL